VIPAVLILAAATFGGASATYFFDDRSRVSFRLAAGSCIGGVALGLIGYMLATTFGMTPAVVACAAVLVAAAPSLLGLVPAMGERAPARRLVCDVGEGARRGWRDLVVARPGFRLRLGLFVGALVLLWPLFHRSMYEKPEGIYTGYIDYFADLTLHLGIISGFSHGQNFPPEHPEYAGTRLAYPFLVDFVAAMLVTAGVSARVAMFIQNYVMIPALIVILYAWSRRLTGSRRAALLVPALVLLNGGLGFTMLFHELVGAKEGIWHYLTHLPHDYSAHEDVYRFDNSFVYWFVPMRSFMLGVPLFLIVIGYWWRALGYEAPEVDPPGRAPAAASDPPSSVRRRRRAMSAEKTVPAPASEVSVAPAVSPGTPAPAPSGISARRVMLGAGIIAGLLPLTHAHTYLTLMGMGGLFFLLTWRQWRLWLVFAVPAVVLALPQILWILSGAATQTDKFRGWIFGWTGHEAMDKWVAAWREVGPIRSLATNPRWVGPVVAVLRTAAVGWYWVLNAGVFIPLLLIALRWRRGGRIVRSQLRAAYLPFLLCFIVPNLYKLAPWDWDNIKVLIYWFIASAPLVALLLVRLSRWPRFGYAAAAVLFVLMTLSGSLDIWRVLTGALEWQDFDADQVATVELLKQNVPPHAVMLTAQVHNHPFLLAGRRSFMGYPGTLWTHGIDYAEREDAATRIYRGDPDALDLLKQHKIEYVVVGPLERIAVKQLNEAFFAEHLPKAAEGYGTILYKVP
jgi:hypothetical protein